MNTNLYRLVYCSHNRIAGTAEQVTEEIQQILTTARTKNAHRGITGALLYNDGNFAQVLEGPLAAIEGVFETIQCDPRHSEVTVVQSGTITGRQFPDWSMAFAGSSTAPIPLAAAAFGAAFSNTDGAGAQMIAVLQDLVRQENDWILSHE